MSTTSVTNSDRANWRSFLVVIGSFLPLLYWHIGGLLQKSHYQFLFLFPIAIWLLVSSLPKMPPLPQIQRWEALIGTTILLLALVGLALSAWVWSPWIAAVCGLLAFCGWLISNGGWVLFSYWFPIVAFSAVLIPLPFGLDQDLVVGLRGYTTRMSSSVLDQFEVLHNMYANVIELPGKPLFIADACSGIHSLFVLMAAALFLCCWGRRGLMHSTCLLISTFGLVLIENVARIVAVAVAWGKGFDWSEGMSHEVLGVVLFCVSLFLILTTDQLLMFFFPPDAPGIAERIRVLRGETGSGNTYLDAPVVKKRSLASGLLLQIPKWTVYAFPVLLLLQLVRIPGAPPDLLAGIQSDIKLPELGLDAIPAEIAGFKVEGFQVIDRVPEDPFGKASQQWHLKKGVQDCLFSIDYPYPGPHDLTECYTNIGWSVEKREILQPDSEEKVNAPEATAVSRLERPLHGHALLVFSHADKDGKAETFMFRDDAKGTAETRAKRRWTSFLNPEKTAEETSKPKNGPYLQFQLLVRSPVEFTDADVAELKTLFEQLKASVREKAYQSASPQ